MAAGTWLGCASCGTTSSAGGCISSGMSKLMYWYKGRRRGSFPGEVQEKPDADNPFPARALLYCSAALGAEEEYCPCQEGNHALELRLPGGIKARDAWPHPGDKTAAGGKSQGEPAWASWCPAENSPVAEPPPSLDPRGCPGEAEGLGTALLYYGTSVRPASFPRQVS